MKSDETFLFYYLCKVTLLYEADDEVNMNQNERQERIRSDRKEE